jgi:hypothetical protein
MLARLLAAFRSKKGFFGALVLFGYAAYGVVAILGNAETVADNLGEALQFLATGPGVLSAVSGGVLLILWALVTQSPETDSSSQAAATPGSTADKETRTTESAELRATRERLERAAYQAKQENDSLRRKVRELEMMSPEEYRAKQEERRELIKKWRAEISAHNFRRHPLGSSWFAQTETYLQMQARLPPKIRNRFESDIGGALSFLGPAHFRGTEGDRRILLREVARIEEEWGVI